MSAIDDSKRWMSIERVAETLAISPQTVRRLVHDGELQAARGGRQWRIASETLEAFLRPKAVPKQP